MATYYVNILCPNCLMFNNLNLKFPKCCVQTSIAIHRFCGTNSVVLFNEVGSERSSTAFAIWCCSDMASCSINEVWCRSRGIALSRTGGSGNIQESIRPWGVAGAVRGRGPGSSISGVAGALDVSLCAFEEAAEEGLHILHLRSKFVSTSTSPLAPLNTIPQQICVLQAYKS